VDFAIVSRLDVFRDAPQASSAAAFGTLGITFRARRAAAGEHLGQRGVTDLRNRPAT